MSLPNILACFALLTLPTVSLCDSVPKEWQRQYRQLEKLINRKDTAGYMATVDKSFVNVSKSGKITAYDAMKQSVVDFFRDYRNLKTTLKPSNYRTQGEEVLLDYEFRVHATLKGKDGKMHPYAYYEKGTDTWRKIDGKYLDVKEVVTETGRLPVK